MPVILHISQVPMDLTVLSAPSASSYIYTTINASVARFNINGNNNTNITPADNAVPPNGLVQFFR